MKNKNKVGSKHHQSNLDFKGMVLFFKIRDIFKPPIKKINRSKVKKGDFVLDYGCGPGSYTFAAAGVVGEKGRIYAADIHPLAIEKIKKRLQKNNLENIETILTDCDTKLADKSIDVVICFDVMHAIADKNKLVKEFHRVLKADGYLSFDDHHYTEEEIMSIFSNGNLFKLEGQEDKMFNFQKMIGVNLSE